MNNENQTIKNVEELEIDAAFSLRRDRENQVKYFFENEQTKTENWVKEIRAIRKKLKESEAFTESLKQLTVEEALEKIQEKNKSSNSCVTVSGSNQVWYTVGYNN